MEDGIMKAEGRHNVHGCVSRKSFRTLKSGKVKGIIPFYGFSEGGTMSRNTEIGDAP